MASRDKDIINLRYKITPQMMEYDRIGQVWLPYLMYFHTPDYSSDVVNTDSRGFRVVNKGPDKISDFRNINKWPLGLFVGGSSAFGIGATSDKNTIPSILNSTTDYLWLNFGGRAFSSTQELILFMLNRRHLDGIRKVIIFSGLNDLALQYLSRGHRKDIGTFFFWNQFNKKMNIKPVSLKRRILDFLLGKNTRTETDRNEPKKEDLLQIFERDILIWKELTGSLGIELYYVLQPFANWVDKKLSREERMLFAGLDNYPQNQWRVLKESMGREDYRWYRDEIRRICSSRGILFFDMNEAISKREMHEDWLYVDRVHLTDKGYKTVAKILKEEVLGK